MKGIMRCANGSIEKCFLRAGEATGVRLFSRRYTEVRPHVKGRDESVALKRDVKGKEEGRRAAARFWVGGAQAMRRAARSLLYLQ